MKICLRLSFLISAKAFSALRVFAIWDRSLLMTLLVLVLNLTPIATNVVCVFFIFNAIPLLLSIVSKYTNQSFLHC